MVGRRGREAKASGFSPMDCPRCLSPSKLGQGHLDSFAPEDEASDLFSPQTWEAGSRERLPAFHQGGPVPGATSPQSYISFQGCAGELGCSGGSGRQMRGAAEQEVSAENSSVLLSLQGRMKNCLLTGPASWRPRSRVSVSLGHF